jgi:hypothetical protein
MELTLLDIYNQAREDHYTVDLDGDEFTASISYGWKIMKDETNRIIILNMTRGGDHYSEATAEEYWTFTQNGWKCGVYVLYLSNCRRKLKVLENKISEALNNKDKLKSIQILKAHRDRIINNYNKIKSKLNDKA